MLRRKVSAGIKSKIKAWFSKERRDEAMENGKESIVRAMRKQGLPLQRLLSGPALAAMSGGGPKLRFCPESNDLLYPKEDKERIKQLLKDENHMFESMAPRDLYAMLAANKADIMLSGGRTQFIALKAKMPWLDINQERHFPYAGYDGMVVEL